MYLKARRYTTGFTLIELLVVIAIIGILASLGTVNIIGIRQRARDGQRKSDLLVIASAVEHYRGDTDNYPTLSGSFSLAPCNQPFTSSDNSIIYLKKIPCDPLNSSQTFSNGNYVYLSSTGSDYSLIACLENSNDKSGVSVSQLPSGVPNPSSCASGNFYVVTDGNPVSSSTGGGGGGSGGSSPTDTPTPTPTSTPTPTPTLTPTPTPGPITLDKTSNTYTNAQSTPTTWNHPYTAHANSILIVGIGLNDASNRTVASVTFNGASLTKYTTYSFQPYSGADLWYLTNPPFPSGSYPIMVTVSGPAEGIAAGASTWYNVNTTSPFSNLKTNPGQSITTTSITISSATNQVVMDEVFLSQDTRDANFTANAPATQLWYSGTSAQGPVAGSSSKTAQAGSTTLTWTNFPGATKSTLWGEIGVALNQAP